MPPCARRPSWPARAPMATPGWSRTWRPWPGGTCRARLASRFGARVDVRDLFEASTVAALGARLDLAGRGETSPVEAGNPMRHRPSFGQERLWFVDQVSPGSAAGNLALGFRVSGAL